MKGGNRGRTKRERQREGQLEGEERGRDEGRRQREGREIFRGSGTEIRLESWRDRL